MIIHILIFFQFYAGSNTEKFKHRSVVHDHASEKVE